VPYGPNGETLVTFYNRIKLGTIKVCKVIPIGSTDALGNKPFTYTVYFRDPATGLIATATLGPIYPGECTFFTRPLPILQGNGKPTAIGLIEDGATGNPNYNVTSITLQGTRGLCNSPLDPNADPTICNQLALHGSNPYLPDGAVNFYLGPGINVVTYTNTAKDP
jgi:hypothetical protein